MALSERTILASVELLYTSHAINIKIERQIWKDDALYSSENFRQAYSNGQRESFINDLSLYITEETATAYADNVGLTDTPTYQDDLP